MIARLGWWEIRTGPPKHLGFDATPLNRLEVAQPEPPPSAQDLEQTAGDFITRHVLEKDSVFFEG